MSSKTDSAIGPNGGTVFSAPSTDSFLLHVVTGERTAVVGGRLNEFAGTRLALSSAIARSAEKGSFWLKR